MGQDRLFALTVLALELSQGVESSVDLLQAFRIEGHPVPQRPELRNRLLKMSLSALQHREPGGQVGIDLRQLVEDLGRPAQVRRG
jgi:hypothetical protein